MTGPKNEKLKPQNQIDKFREAARDLGTNEDEAAFDRVLKRISKAPPAKKAEKPKGK